MKLLKQLAIICAIFFVGHLFQTLTNFPIPSTVLVMIFLLILLPTGVVKLKQIEEVSQFLLDHLTFLFIPGGVELIASLNLIKDQWLQILILIVKALFNPLLIAIGLIICFLIYNNGKLILIDSSETIYATAKERNTVIVSMKGKFECSSTLSHLEEKLNDQKIFRAHKSFLINLDYIEEIIPWFNSTYLIELKHTEEKIPVSRSNIKYFREIMNIS